MTGWTWLMLAETNYFYYLGDHFRPGRSQTNLQGAGIVAAVIATIVLFVLVWSRWQAAHQRRIKNDPWLLLAELCRAHRLSAVQRRLVMRIAGQARLAEPATILLDPAILTGAAERAGNRQLKQALAKLKEQLFSSPETTTAAPMARRLRVD